MAKLLQDVTDRLKGVENDIETMQLGIYGDSKNEIKGLITNVRELQTTVKKLQEQWKKAIYFSSGAIAVIEVMVRLFKWITET